MRPRNFVRWLYRLTETWEWESGLSFQEDRVFRDRDGTVRMELGSGAVALQYEPKR